MAYERQFFTKGQVLTAEEMNELDAWLAHICGREITAAETNSRGELVFTFRDGGTLNVGEVGGVNAAELTEAVEKALQEAKESGEFNGEPGVPGESGVYVGSDTPPANATVWINPEGEPTSTEDWEFDLDDGSTEEKTVVVVGSDDASANGKLAILRMKDANGNWVEIPAIVGSKGESYILTDSDRIEIATLAKASITTADIGGAADTNYSILKARAESLNRAETNPTLNGAIAWTYE